MNPNNSIIYRILAVLISLLIISGCSVAPAPIETIAPTVSLEPLTETPSLTALPTFTIQPTNSPIPTNTQAPPTQTPSPTLTPTITLTPTPEQPYLVVNVQAHCRYGPGVAYLHAGDLYPGDKGLIYGKNQSGTWLWFKPEKLSYKCWAATSTVDVYGDLKTVHVVTSRLPYSNLYGPVQNVQTARDGDQVTIAWDPEPFTKDDDRGYMLQLTTCENGQVSTQTIQTYDTQITVTDEQNCSGSSGGTIWGVEKHGYTQPVDIPWP